MVRGTGNGEIDGGMQSKSSRQRAKRNSLEVQHERSVAKLEINVAESNLKPGDISRRYTDWDYGANTVGEGKLGSNGYSHERKHAESKGEDVTSCVVRGRRDLCPRGGRHHQHQNKTNLDFLEASDEV